MEYQNFSVSQGDREVKPVVVTIDDTPFDLTGYTITLYVKESYDEAASVLLEKDGVLRTPETDGLADITLLPTDTKALNYGAYYYEVKIYKSDYVYTIAKGKFSILKTIKNNPLG